MSGFIIAGLILIGVLLIVQARSLRQSTGLPWRKVVFQDTSRREVAKPLFSEQYRLTGKPDYIIEQAGALIPVEVKPNRRDSEPRQSDVLQVAAYCLLVEETTGTAPPFGLLRYADTTFEIRWDDELYDELCAVLDAMREDRHAADVPRSHDERWRCRGCGFFDRCSDALE